MQWNPDALCKALNATLDDNFSSDSRYFFRFYDNKLRYYCDIQADNGTVMFAADFDEPLQAMPMFEFSFRCEIIEIRACPYGENYGDAVFFYEYKNSYSNSCGDGVRLVLNPKPDGNWYFWGNYWKEV